MQRKKDQPTPDEVLKLGEEFCFHLDGDISGYAVAFQEYKGIMHPLPLGQNEEMATLICQGKQFLPLDDNKEPEKLTESSDLGHHRFIISVAGESSQLPTPTIPPNSSGTIEAHVISVQVVP
ncbi:hypothetical protein MACH17_19850 [Phaeobacter inhibens]|uniref:hypothetical protein n=1 Tax=Phaeobacter inhibens TaxID=221822 RepID=UPI0027604B2E|nr:hypothetical protein [Phaeobacter inhibens]GLO70468.1 hypothetical protein MACH17_19850 [Phaeobacter inhibens]